MDHESFDRFARLLSGSGSRRTALSALLAGAFGGAAIGADAKGKGNGKGKGKGPLKGRNHTRDKHRQGETGASAEVSAQAADCLSIGPSSNMNGCDFSGMDLSGRDLSGSSMRGTNFRNANLCGANLSSSTLTNADLRGADLTRATLKSSGCSGLKTDSATTFCQTKMCNGTIRSDDCQGTPASSVCCGGGDCAERVCETGTCEGERCAYTKQADGGSGTLCPSPGECCDGNCCTEGQECCNGSCCAEGQKCCGGTCVGADVCCTNNQQGCPDGQTCCGGTCIASDVCCTNGQQGCPQGQTCCDSTCVNTLTDNDNCGTCGNECEGGTTCQNGTCSEPPPICLEALQACVQGQQPSCCDGRTCRRFSPGCWGPEYCCRSRGEPCTNACDCCSVACLHSGGTATCL